MDVQYRLSSKEVFIMKSPISFQNIAPSKENNENLSAAACHVV